MQCEPYIYIFSQSWQIKNYDNDKERGGAQSRGG